MLRIITYLEGKVNQRGLQLLDPHAPSLFYREEWS